MCSPAVIAYKPMTRTKSLKMRKNAQIMKMRMTLTSYYFQTQNQSQWKTRHMSNHFQTTVHLLNRITSFKKMQTIYKQPINFQHMINSK